MKSFNTETIRALMPIVLTATGGVIALVLIISSIASPNGANLDDAKWASSMSLAGAAIGGGAGLAQSNKGESNIKTRNMNSRSN
jgi:hypothetical protein